MTFLVFALLENLVFLLSFAFRRTSFRYTYLLLLIPLFSFFAHGGAMMNFSQFLLFFQMGAVYIITGRESRMRGYLFSVLFHYSYNIFLFTGVHGILLQYVQ